MSVPRGHIRHPVSGCIIPEASIGAHELALAERSARHSLDTPSRSSALSAAEAAIDARLAETKELEAKLAAKNAALRAALGEDSTPSTEA